MQLQYITIVRGNINAKLAKERDGEILGKFELGTRIEHRENASNSKKDQVIDSAWFQEYPWRMWTRRSLSGKSKSKLII